MLKNANLGKEVSITIVNKIGILADMSKILTDQGINIEAVAGYAKDNQKEAEIIFVTDDNFRAVDALRNSGYQSTKEREVIIIELENKPGALKNITTQLAQNNIDIKYIYGTTCPAGCPARIVLSTSDNEKTLAVFNK